MSMKYLILFFVILTQNSVICQESVFIDFFIKESIKSIISRESENEPNKKIFLIYGNEYEKREDTIQYRFVKLKVDSTINFDFNLICNINSDSEISVISEESSKLLNFSNFYNTRIFINGFYRIMHENKIGYLLHFYNHEWDRLSEEILGDFSTSHVMYVSWVNNNRLSQPKIFLPLESLKGHMEFPLHE